MRLVNGGPSEHPPGSTFEGMDLPLISSNIVDADTKEPIFPPYLIKRVKGVPVAFLGATTITTPTVVEQGPSTAWSSWTRPRRSTATCPSSRPRASRRWCC